MMSDNQTNGYSSSPLDLQPRKSSGKDPLLLHLFSWLHPEFKERQQSIYIHRRSNVKSNMSKNQKMKRKEGSKKILSMLERLKIIKQFDRERTVDLWCSYCNKKVQCAVTIYVKPKYRDCSMNDISNLIEEHCSSLKKLNEVLEFDFAGRNFQIHIIAGFEAGLKLIAEPEQRNAMPILSKEYFSNKSKTSKQSKSNKKRR